MAVSIEALSIYVMTFLIILVVVVITAVLFTIGRRFRKETAFTGFSPCSRDEKYVGYALFGAGLAIILLSIFEIISILFSGTSANVSFGLNDLPGANVGEQLLIPMQIINLIESVFFWIMILGYGGGTIAFLGIDMMKGRRIKLRIKNQTIHAIQV